MSDLLTTKRLRALALASLGMTAACGIIPGPAKPVLSITPMAAIVKLEGDAAMDSPGSPPIQNPPVNIGSSLNLDDRETGVGGTLAYGDGFSGFEFNFFRFKVKRFKVNGIMEHDFGNLLRGDEVHSESLFNQIRANYIAPVLEDDKLTQATLRLGLGAGLHYNDFRLETQEINLAREQTLKFDSGFGVPMLLLRGDAEYKPFRARVDVGWSHGAYSGMDGNFLDLGLTVHYHIQKGISAWIGYWYYELPGDDQKDGLAFKFDMRYTGYMAGIRFDV